ncbi:MAG: hypothetical protein QUT30_08050 [Acidobacteriota bacterium]|nr:hypothetical protein [Acidobacteriota bacterium]
MTSGADDYKSAIRENGLTTFPYVLMALNIFVDEIYKLSRPVIEARLPDLGAAMGVTIKPKDLTRYVNPGDFGTLQEYEGDWGWIAVRFTLQKPKYVDAYFGLNYQPGENRKTIVKLAAMMSPGYASQRDFLYARGQEVSPHFVNPYANEVSLSQPITTTAFDSYSEILDSLIDTWIEVWKNIGGVAGLP